MQKLYKDKVKILILSYHKSLSNHNVINQQGLILFV